ncbi:hypothetical protein LTS14_002170 [Recurvomyces mirabilis]|uniref:uncharacterized protein n=1 Tax=Recurvomyces mirabilis TaxID=574656 RepID=UPI002DE03F64|nr:hypothetical protein LTS14_002170 [Recurvomyces mirabilis]
MDDRRERLRIRSRTKKEDVQQAKKLVTDADEVPASWTAVDHGQKVDMLERLNEELDRQRLPTITMITYSHRMAQAMPPIIRQAKRKTGGGGQLVQAEASTGSQSTSPTPLPGERIVLPPIRAQPELAQHLDATAYASGREQQSERTDGGISGEAEDEQGP